MSVAQPSDVYDIASLVVAQLVHLQNQIVDSTPPRAVFNPGLKIPSDVYQRVGILEAQLDQLESESSNYRYPSLGDLWLAILAAGGQKRKGTPTGGLSRAIFSHGTSTRSTAQPPTDRNAKVGITDRWNGRDRSVGGRTCPSARDIWTSHDGARARGKQSSGHPHRLATESRVRVFRNPQDQTAELGRGEF